MRKTKDIHLKLDLSTAASLEKYISAFGGTRNRHINKAIETYIRLLLLHRTYLQYQELGCNLEQFRADYKMYDLGELSWLLQND